MRLKKILALALTLCVCASLMVPMASAAQPGWKEQVPTVDIALTAQAEGRSNGNYNVTVEASMEMTEQQAGFFANVYTENKTKADEMTFVLTLSGEQLKNLTADALNFEGPNGLYQQVGTASLDKDNGKLTLTYKLGSSAPDNADALKAALQQKVTFKAARTDMESAVLAPRASVLDASVDVKTTASAYAVRIAYGTTRLSVSEYDDGGSSSGGGGGSSGGSSTPATPAATSLEVVATNDQTGVTDTMAGIGTSGGTATSSVAPAKATFSKANGASGAIVAGDTVQTKVTTEKGYKSTGLVITNDKGEKIVVEPILNADGTVDYKFVMPEGKVKVEVLYESVPYMPQDSGVDTTFITEEHIAYASGNSNMFRPNAKITRAEVATMLYRLLRNKDVEITTSFSDVPEGKWYAKAVNTFASLGFLKGYEDGTFRPDALISRAEFTAAVVRFASAPATVGREFADVSSTYWAHDEIGKATALGWIIGYPEGDFRPTGALTRAEAVTVINRMLGRPGDEAATQSRGAVFTDVKTSSWYFTAISEACTAHNFTFNADAYVETWVNG